MKFNEALKRVLDRLVSDLIVNTRRRIREAGLGSVDDVRRCRERLFAFSPEVEQERQEIKRFLYDNLYYSPMLRADKEQGEQVIAELFSFFMSAPEELPGGYQSKADEEPVYRVVCDYIAGMTDNYVQEQHRRFCSGSRRVEA